MNKQKQTNKMKKLFFISIIAIAQLVVSSNVYSQTETKTSVGSLNIVKEVKPPILQQQGQINFTEPSGNRAIDANETCILSLMVKNSGMGDGYGLIGRIKTKGNVQGISTQDVTLPTLKVGQTYTVDFPITANMNTVDGEAEFILSIEEPNGFNLPEIPIKISTRAFVAPMVEFRGHIMESGAVTLAKNTPYTMQVLIQNTGYGVAENVTVSLDLPQGVVPLSDENTLNNATLNPGQTHTMKYTFIIPQAYSSSRLPLTISIQERYGKYSKNGEISFEVKEQDMIAGNTISPTIRKEETIVPVSLGSDVDKNIPKTTEINNSLHVMIIANQNYRNEQSVSTSLSDGRMMKEYCMKTLGVPEKNISLKEDRTNAEMQADIEAFAKTIRYNSNDKFIFFYFGHGMRDKEPQVNDAYLMPIDGSSLRLDKTGLSRNWMMQEFSKSKPKQLVVYLESCFSGATSEDIMLKYAENSSGLRLSDDVSSNFSGNIILLTASSKAQTANAYPSQRHNVFTYEFLKALQNNKGNVNWETMFDTVKKNTSKTAWNELGRDQEPSITISTTLGDNWKKWSVK